MPIAMGGGDGGVVVSAWVAAEMVLVGEVVSFSRSSTPAHLSHQE